MSGQRILIVEDEPVEARRLENKLVKKGYIVVGVALSVSEAVRMAQETRPALVLMDIKLPHMRGGDQDPDGGLKAAAEIRRLRIAIAIVFMTGYELTEERVKKVLALHAAPFFLRKPLLNLPQVFDIIELALAKQAGRRVVFICYAHEDSKIKEEATKFLKVIRGLGVESWDDRQIPYGAAWRAEIEAAIGRADAALLLVSSDFMASTFIEEFELPALLAARSERGLRVFIAFVGAVPKAALQHKGLDGYQGLNSPDKPLNEWTKKRRQREMWAPLCDVLAKMDD